MLFLSLSLSLFSLSLSLSLSLSVSLCLSLSVSLSLCLCFALSLSVLSLSKSLSLSERTIDRPSASAPGAIWKTAKAAQVRDQGALSSVSLAPWEQNGALVLLRSQAQLFNERSLVEIRQEMTKSGRTVWSVPAGRPYCSLYAAIEL